MEGARPRFRAAQFLQEASPTVHVYAHDRGGEESSLSWLRVMLDRLWWFAEFTATESDEGGHGWGSGVNSEPQTEPVEGFVLPGCAATLT